MVFIASIHSVASKRPLTVQVYHSVRFNHLSLMSSFAGGSVRGDFKKKLAVSLFFFKYNLPLLMSWFRFETEIRAGSSVVNHFNKESNTKTALLTWKSVYDDSVICSKSEPNFSDRAWWMLDCFELCLVVARVKHSSTSDLGFPIM